MQSGEESTISLNNRGLALVIFSVSCVWPVDGSVGPSFSDSK